MVLATESYTADRRQRVFTRGFNGWGDLPPGLFLVTGCGACPCSGDGRTGSWWGLATAGGPEARNVPAVVPGCVHLDLLAAGKIPDPFYRDNQKSAAREAHAENYRLILKSDQAKLIRFKNLYFSGHLLIARSSLIWMLLV
jgi:hypothetical protein